MDDEDAPWEPGPDFQQVFIRVNSQGECVISGPQDQVARLRKQLVDLLLDGCEGQIPDDIRRFQIR
jgi:acyl transferase domain-containing protein